VTSARNARQLVWLLLAVAALGGCNTPADLPHDGPAASAADINIVDPCAKQPLFKFGSEGYQRVKLQSQRVFPFFATGEGIGLTKAEAEAAASKDGQGRAAINCDDARRRFDLCRGFPVCTEYCAIPSAHDTPPATSTPIELPDGSPAWHASALRARILEACRYYPPDPPTPTNKRSRRL
jgi:hypothetical protein